MPVRPLTFVVGTGRCGSTALSRIVNLHPDVLSLNEMFASLSNVEPLPKEPLSGEEFWRLLAEPNVFFDRMIRSGVPLPEFLYNQHPGRFSAETGIPALCLMVLPHLTEDPDALLDAIEPELRALPARPVGEQYRALFEALIARCGGRVVIERSGYSLSLVPAMRAAFPEARFVHLFRDGPDCAVSMSRHIGFRAISAMREICQITGVDSVSELTMEHARELPPGLSEVLTDRFDPALLQEWPMPVPGFGSLWSELITDGVAQLAQVPDGMRTALSYEKLLDSPHEELTRLARFVGVDPLQEWLDAGAATLDHARRGAALRLPPDELSQLRENCAAGTRALSSAGVRP